MRYGLAASDAIPSQSVDMDVTRRTADRHRAALSAWSAIRADLEAIGLKPKLFGSLANSGFASHSDIDIMVRLGKSGLSRSAVERIVSKAAREIPVDLFFEEDLTQADLETLLAGY